MRRAQLLPCREDDGGGVSGADGGGVGPHASHRLSYAPSVSSRSAPIHLPRPLRVRGGAVFALLALGATAASAQAVPPPPGSTAKPQDTEQWTPVPPVVTPGATATAPPSDAIVLFDGKDLSQWVNTRDKAPAGWRVAGGIATVEKSAGNIETKRSFRDYQLHLEWRVPKDVTGSGQSRGNSGVFLASTGPADAGYELQILDSYQNTTYVNGQAGSLYKQYPPLVNASRKPGEWQAYDVVWTAPRFAADGKVTSPAKVTAFHNGVLIQDAAVLSGETLYIGKPVYHPYTSAPIKLQAHGDPSPPLSFRNIWVRELPEAAK